MRTFEDKQATREQVPVLVGLVGPSGGGKTYSALELATGIQAVVGGDIGFIDTESKRACHYAERFKFRHLDFKAPFDSLSYLAAIEHFQKKGCKIIVVDSMSHEHEGPGGLLEAHEAELNRIAGDDYQKRERCKMLAWQKPKAARRHLINSILQLGVHGVFCFRAKEKMKLVSGKSPVALGWQPIAGEEFVFEMMLNALLPPNANGVPSWAPEEAGERQMVKLPAQFKDIFKPGQQLTREHGRLLAEWARGGIKAAPAPEQAKPVPVVNDTKPTPATKPPMDIPFGPDEEESEPEPEEMHMPQKETGQVMQEVSAVATLKLMEKVKKAKSYEEIMALQTEVANAHHETRKEVAPLWNEKKNLFKEQRGSR